MFCDVCDYLKEVYSEESEFPILKKVHGQLELFNKAILVVETNNATATIVSEATITKRKASNLIPIAAKQIYNSLSEEIMYCVFGSVGGYFWKY